MTIINYSFLPLEMRYDLGTILSTSHLKYINWKIRRKEPVHLCHHKILRDGLDGDGVTD